MEANEVRALVDAEIRAANRAERGAVLWDPQWEPYLLARPELRHPPFWLVFGPAYHADFDFYEVVFDEERAAFGLTFRGQFIGYRRSFIHALEGMPHIQERLGSPITCPVCGDERSAKGAIGPLPWGPLLAALRNSAGRQYEARFLFVCSVCVAEGRAIEADPREQFYGDGPPYKAYFDVTLRCEDCRSDFVFTAKEQRFWFEELHFFVESYPKQCRSCRHARREHRALTAELGELKALDSHDPKALAQMAEIYLELGDMERAALYLRRAKNRTADPSQKAILIGRLAKLSSGPGG